MSTRILIFVPVRESGRSVVMHGSLLDCTTGLGVNVAPRVGSGGMVAVNADVFVGTGVGEGCVAVGMAA